MHKACAVRHRAVAAVEGNKIAFGTGSLVGDQVKENQIFAIAFAREWGGEHTSVEQFRPDGGFAASQFLFPDKLTCYGVEFHKMTETVAALLVHFAAGVEA